MNPTCVSFLFKIPFCKHRPHMQRKKEKEILNFFLNYINYSITKKGQMEEEVENLFPCLKATWPPCKAEIVGIHEWMTPEYILNNKIKSSVENYSKTSWL